MSTDAEAQIGGGRPGDGEPQIVDRSTRAGDEGRRDRVGRDDDVAIDSCRPGAVEHRRRREADRPRRSDRKDGREEWVTGRGRVVSRRTDDDAAILRLDLEEESRRADEGERRRVDE